ncbi:MAG TPA: glutamyl-tRNA reductase [Gemmatimonadales bacterium]
MSHHTALVEERERFAFTASETTSLLQDLQAAGLPGLLLSTCNRCELYWFGPGDGEAWFRALAGGRRPGPQLTLEHGLPAVRHLFKVSAGLDSQILGETEVLGQVRRAYDAARAAGTTVPEMDRIFSAALAAGRRVRRETVLGRHPHSVSSAAVDLAYQKLGHQIAKALVLGAGEAAEGVLRALHQCGAQVTLLNRHSEKAAVLAAAWRADRGSWEELDKHLVSADLMLVATASARPVVSASELTRAAHARERQKLLVIDLAVPRNVEPSARAIEGIELLDLDDLQQQCCPAAGTASAELAEAEGILEEELVRLGLSLRGRVAAPRLAELHAMSQKMAEQESAWALAQLQTLSETQQEVVRQMADRLVRRVLYPVSRSIREEAEIDF